MSPFRLSALLAAFCAARAATALELAPLFQDHGVLQCDKPVPVWGRAAPGEHVDVAFSGQRIGATAGADGRWIAVLAPVAAGPLGSDLTVSGKSTRVVHDVVVGEVWLCSGGAEMGALLGAAAPSEVPLARHPLIRCFTVRRQAAASPMEEAGGGWSVCSPEGAGRLPAIGYLFARELYSRLGVPVGIVVSACAGAPLESWMSAAALAPFSGAARGPAASPPSPPSSLFNGMIHPLVPYAIRGALWCQGEGSAGGPADTGARFPALISAWRSHFGEGDFPFFWVELAGPRCPPGRPEDPWARLREAQSRALALPATAQAVAIDVGDAGDAEIARRLALIAKASVYSIPVDSSGPVFSGYSAEGASIRVQFRFAGEGLTASGKPLQSFEVAGADRVFHVARATIEGETVVVRSPAVARPVAVRYAWRGAADANLYNGAGLPAPPFRSDDW